MADKEVRFDIYCQTCKYHGMAETEDPCYDCLAEPANTDSRKPYYWEEAK